MISAEGSLLGAEAARLLARIARPPMGPGLTDAEVACVEHDYGFEFADDHRAFLQAGLPLNVPPEEGRTWSEPWPDWRDADPGRLRVQLDRPVEGVLFDVERNAFWHPAWGPRPADPRQARETARTLLARVPKMIPVYGHRYLPAGHGGYGHPVLSMVQTDIVIYGADLADYIRREFGGAEPAVDTDRRPASLIPFWSDFL